MLNKIKNYFLFFKYTSSSYYLNVTFSALSTVVNDLTVIHEDWIKNGKEILINPFIVENLLAQGFNIIADEPTISSIIN